jgi:osmoprotectant transport system permease protein
VSPVSVLAWLADPAHWSGADGIPTRLAEHVSISAAAVALGVAVALPLGLAIGHTGRGALLALNLANVGRAVPSYAVLVMILPISLRVDPDVGLDVIPTFGAMTLLAIPPILVNAYAGIRAVDREIVEAARGMGMREREILGRVEVPVALPVIVGGIRTAAVQVVATATLGAVVSYGGLGRYLIDGYARREFDRIFAGVVLVAGLALFTEAAFALAQRALTSRGLRRDADRARRPPVPDPDPGLEPGVP